MTVGIYYECEEELVFVGYFECQDTGSKVNGNHFDIFVETLDTEYDPFRFLIEDRNMDNRKIKFVLIDAVGQGEINRIEEKNEINSKDDKR